MHCDHVAVIGSERDAAPDSTQFSREIGQLRDAMKSGGSPETAQIEWLLRNGITVFAGCGHTLREPDKKPRR